jgi:hypothetical protein
MTLRSARAPATSMIPLGSSGSAEASRLSTTPCAIPSGASTRDRVTQTPQGSAPSFEPAPALRPGLPGHHCHVAQRLPRPVRIKILGPASRVLRRRRKFGLPAPDMPANGSTNTLPTAYTNPGAEGFTTRMTSSAQNVNHLNTASAGEREPLPKTGDQPPADPAPVSLVGRARRPQDRPRLCGADLRTAQLQPADERLQRISQLTAHPACDGAVPAGPAAIRDAVSHAELIASGWDGNCNRRR